MSIASQNRSPRMISGALGEKGTECNVSPLNEVDMHYFCKVKPLHWSNCLIFLNFQLPLHKEL